MKFKRILTPLLIIMLLFSIIVMGAPTYGNVGPTTDFEGDVGVPAGSGYYIDDTLLTYSDVGAQPLDTALTNISALTYVSPSFIKLTADDTYAVRTLTETKTDLSLNLVENLKVKLDGTAAPAAATDDVTLGYAVGSRWFDITNDKEYVCLDNTDGAAVWTETTGAGGGAGTFLDLTDTPAAYDDGKYAKSTAAGIVFDTPAGAGETNTVSNIGAQVEIFKQKTVSDLEFRTLKANSDKVIVTTDATGSGITVGTAAIDRASTFPDNRTLISGTACSATGTITSIEIWANTSSTGLNKIAILENVGTNNFTTRDICTIGNVTAGSKQTFTVDNDSDPIALDVVEGDYIGLYLEDGAMELDTSGGSIWLLAGDYLNCTDKTFTLSADKVLSLYATGTSAPLDYIRFDVVPAEIAPEIGGLLSTTTVSFAADADTTLYTVPTGKRCVLTHAIVVAAADAGATTTVSIGQDTAETDFVPANTLSNLDAQYDAVVLQPIPNTTPLKIKSYAAATVIEAQVASQSGAAGNTIYLFGILY